MNDFIFATFTFGDFYHQQTNRLIESSLKINKENRPLIFVITENCDNILKADNVICENICIYDSKYLSFNPIYEKFDFSVKRYSILQALKYGYTKIALIDNDIIFLPESYDKNIVSNFFEQNTVSGPTCYLYKDHLINNSYLGMRFSAYMRYFNNDSDMSKYMDMIMPEDCITYFNFIDANQGYNFVDIWGVCRDYKYKVNLNEAPVGNIDEICYCAINCKMNLKVADYSNKFKMFYADHIRHKKNKTANNIMLDNMTLDSFYNARLLDIGSDICEHMPTLQKYGSMCSHITEFGARHGSSTIALILAKAQYFISYDISITDNINILLNLSKSNNINFNFKQQNVIASDFVIDETDLLFIDTLHTYNQLKVELNRHSSQVKKYIIIHDTETFKHRGEDRNNEKGLMDAIGEFINKNNVWVIEKIFTNNNGLTILKRT